MSSVSQIVDRHVRAKNHANQPLRDRCAAEIREADELYAHVQSLPNVLKHTQAKAALESAGIVTASDEPDLEKFVRMDVDNKERDRVAGDLCARIRVRLDANISPLFHKAAEDTIRELEADRKSLDAIAGVVAKYQVDQHPLVRGLDDEINRLRAAAQRPVNTRWHPDVRIALSQSLFPETAPLVVYPGPAASPSATPVAPGALKTAADLAGTRAG